MPDAMTVWIRRSRAVAARSSRSIAGPIRREQAEAVDPMLAALTCRHERLALRRHGSVAHHIRLVTIPERLAIEETARAAELLADTGVDVSGLIVNRVLPDDLEGEFYRSRKAQEATYLAEIDRRFKRLPRVRVRQLPRDVYGLASLAAVSEQLLS